MKMDDMRTPAIMVWDGCDPRVLDAVEGFQKRWRPSSNTRHTLRLIEELIDPALSAFGQELPQNRVIYVIGAESGATFSRILGQAGFANAQKAQRYLLRSFVRTKDGNHPKDKVLQNTLETLMGLIAACLRGTVRKATLPGTPLRNGRQREFCKFCGNQAEYTAVSAGNKDIDFHPFNVDGKSITLRLSSGYCEEHRPKLHNGAWNPAYQSAKRSAAQFEIELLRLVRQSCALQLGEARSEDALVDAYFYLYALKYRFHPADESELRCHARLMTDMKLTDQKKKIIVLHKMGFSQSAIACRTKVKSRQAIFKALATIPSIFFKIPIPADFTVA